MTAMERIEALERRVAELERQLGATNRLPGYWGSQPFGPIGYPLNQGAGMSAAPSKGGLDVQA
jgi:hypothetical protein